MSHGGFLILMTYGLNTTNEGYNPHGRELEHSKYSALESVPDLKF